MSHRVPRPLFARLASAFRSAFDRSDLDMFLNAEEGIEKRLDDVSERARFPVQIDQLLDWAEREGKLELLVEGAARTVPGNQDLQQVRAALREHLERVSAESRLTTATDARLLQEHFRRPEVGEPEYRILDQHQGFVTGIAWSPDGCQLLVSANEELIVYEEEGHQPLVSDDRSKTRYIGPLDWQMVDGQSVMVAVAVRRKISRLEFWQDLVKSDETRLSKSPSQLCLSSAGDLALFGRVPEKDRSRFERLLSTHPLSERYWYLRGEDLLLTRLGCRVTEPYRPHSAFERAYYVSEFAGTDLIRCDDGRLAWEGTRLALATGNKVAVSRPGGLAFEAAVQVTPWDESNRYDSPRLSGDPPTYSGSTPRVTDGRITDLDWASDEVIVVGCDDATVRQLTLANDSMGDNVVGPYPLRFASSVEALQIAGAWMVVVCEDAVSIVDRLNGIELYRLPREAKSIQQPALVRLAPGNNKVAIANIAGRAIAVVDLPRLTLTPTDEVASRVGDAQIAGQEIRGIQLEWDYKIAESVIARSFAEDHLAQRGGGVVLTASGWLQSHHKSFVRQLLRDAVGLIKERGTRVREFQWNDLRSRWRLLDSQFRFTVEVLRAFDILICQRPIFDDRGRPREENRFTVPGDDRLRSILRLPEGATD